MFFDRFERLCEQSKVSCAKAASDIGLSNATTTKWKKTGATPNGDTLSKISSYFCVPVDYLLDYAGQAAIDDNVWKLAKIEEEIERNPDDEDLRIQYDLLYEETEDLRFAYMMTKAKNAPANGRDVFTGLTNSERDMLFAYRSAPQNIKDIVDTALAPYLERKQKDEAM